jgi:hypothetical protein
MQTRPQFLAVAMTIAGLLMIAGNAPAQPANETITYQGRLDEAGTPVNGSVDLVFTFYDAPTGGILLSRDSVNGVAVNDGYFTQDITVPSGFFVGDVWLEIRVANPSGSGQFETLTPRQPVTPAPSALLARNALVAESVDEDALFWREGALSGTITTATTVNRVGIGIDAPIEPLSVFGRGDQGESTAIAAAYAFPPAGGETSVIRAQAQASSGDARAIWASTASPFGYAGYFEGGRNYFEGRIGVGEEDAPNYLVDAKGANASLRAQSTGNTPAYLRLEREGSGVGHIALGNDDSMYFNLNATDRMVLDTDGQLGLGTQTPGASVDVVNGGSTQTGMRVTNNAGGTGFEADLGFSGTGFLADVGPSGTGFSAIASGSGSVGVFASNLAADGIAIDAQANSLTGSTVGVSAITRSSNGVAVRAESTFAGVGVHAIAPSGQALLADGNVAINGTLSKSAGSFRIDHPLSPKTHYLSHSFVESPDMMNIYNGNVTTDADGYAEVTLPDWFESLNRDFRYQLTVIGSFARAAVWEKIRDNRFVIRTSEPSVEVSWQVTGIRDDPYARANPIEVETPKPEDEVGSYQFAEWEDYAPR